MKIKGLTIIFIITFLITFWINFIDFKLNTFWIFTNKAGKAETIIDNLCLSYIAGYIFYFINVYLVEEKEKKHLLPYVAFKVSLIIGNNYHIVKILKQDSKLKDYYPNANEFEKLLSFENLAKIKVYNYENKTFIQFLNIRAESTLVNIQQIFKSSKYVDDELKAILLRMSESMLLDERYCLNQTAFNKGTFKRYNGVFTSYFKEVKALDEYYIKNLQKYQELNFAGRHKKTYEIKSQS